MYICLFVPERCGDVNLSARGGKLCLRFFLQLTEVSQKGIQIWVISIWEGGREGGREEEGGREGGGREGGREGGGREGGREGGGREGGRRVEGGRGEGGRKGGRRERK